MLDLQDICDKNLPKNTDALIKLKANVKLILEVIIHALTAN